MPAEGPDRLRALPSAPPSTRLPFSSPSPQLRTFAVTIIQLTFSASVCLPPFSHFDPLSSLLCLSYPSWLFDSLNPDTPSMLGEVMPLMGLLFPVLVVNSCSPASEYLSISIYLAG
ncbi:unnamed protein product [Pleuronectes platessa]|uniref:Uncharacterized protein n=1 Tax=Pleuronectes platessa TaxID=8262 RepID=A0A9N7UZH7_PLEPL|nr:unnamed protein product [Pleuronectes platessa]